MVKKKILVIDDEELIVNTMTKLLAKQNYEPYVFKNGKEAQNFAKKNNVDLIISDIRMPGENGIEIVSGIYQIIDQKKEKKPPVIFITGYADEKLEEDARKLKPLDYVYKPFDLEIILERIKNVLK